MNILELDSYNLADAVKFNKELNPRIWQSNKMRPEVRAKLLEIAEDFKEFLGLTDIEIKDIVVSGSNASREEPTKLVGDRYLDRLVHTRQRYEEVAVPIFRLSVFVVLIVVHSHCVSNAEPSQHHGVVDDADCGLLCP